MHTQAPERTTRTRILENQFIGATAILLAIGGIVAIGLSVPWEIRFPILVAATLFGPAIPAVRLFAGRTLLECVVYGISADVALLMLVSLGLVMARSWYPSISIIILLLASLAAGTRLMMVSETT